MRYIMQQVVTSWGKLATTEITEEEAINYLTEDGVNDIMSNTTARSMGATVTVEVDNGLYVGIEF